MKLKIEVNRKLYEVDILHPLDLSIPIRFDEAQVNAFGAPPAATAPLKVGEFVGDTRTGGSCNCETITFTPHCNGTHTEGVGHITDQRIPLHSLVSAALIPATLITVRPTRASATDDHYFPDKQPDDLLITADDIERAVQFHPKDFSKGLVIRTLPNDSSKLSRRYGKEQTPFFSMEAMQRIVDLHVDHLICDLPSVDRANDGGHLMAHRTYWGVRAGEKAVYETRARTITELAFVPSFIPDGIYLLNLVPLGLVADAVPSRPILYSVREF
jgi:arylformamidase